MRGLLVRIDDFIVMKKRKLRILLQLLSVLWKSPSDHPCSRHWCCIYSVRKRKLVSLHLSEVMRNRSGKRKFDRGEIHPSDEHLKWLVRSGLIILPYYNLQVKPRWRGELVKEHSNLGRGPEFDSPSANIVCIKKKIKKKKRRNNEFDSLCKCIMRW